MFASVISRLKKVNLFLVQNPIIHMKFLYRKEKRIKGPVVKGVLVGRPDVLPS